MGIEQASKGSLSREKEARRKEQNLIGWYSSQKEAIPTIEQQTWWICQGISWFQAW